MSHLMTAAEYAKQLKANPEDELAKARKAKLDPNTYFSRQMENRKSPNEPVFAAERILASEQISMVDVPGERDSTRIEEIFENEGLRIAYMTALKNRFYRGIQKGVHQRANILDAALEGTDLNPVDVAPYEFVKLYEPQIPTARLVGNITFTANRKVEVAKVEFPESGFWRKVEQLEEADVTKVTESEESVRMQKQMGAFVFSKEKIEAGMASQEVVDLLDQQRSIWLIELNKEVGVSLRTNSTSSGSTGIDVSTAAGLAQIYSLLDSPYQANTILGNKTAWRVYVAGLLENNALRNQGSRFSEIPGDPTLLNSISSMDGIGYLDGAGFADDRIYIYDYRNAFDLRIHNDNVLEEREYKMEVQGWRMQLSAAHLLRVRDTNSMLNVPIS